MSSEKGKQVMAGEQQSDAIVLYQFFGLLDGQTKMEFIQEMKELSDESKAQLSNGIRDESLTY